jgi:outer membrane protein
MVQALRDSLPVITTEGRYVVEHGALFSANVESIRANAYYHAHKAVQIIQGVLPADLPVTFEEVTGLLYNEAIAIRQDWQPGGNLRYFARMVPAALRGTPLTLSQAVSRALLQHPSQLAEADAVIAARENAARAKTDYLPQLNLDLSADYRDDHTVHNHFDEITNDALRASLSLDQKLLSVPTLKAIELARQRQRVREMSQTEASLELEASVEVAYLELLRALERLSVVRRYKNRIDDIHQVAMAMIEFGGDERTDALRWEDEFAKGTQALVDAETEVHTARVTLNLLLNQPGSTEILPQQESFSKDQRIREYLGLAQFTETPADQQATEDFLVRQAVAQNPALERLNINVDIQETLLSQNRGRWYPEIGFRASLQGVDELENTPAFQEEHVQWQLGAKLHLPLFLGGERWQERAMLRADLSRTQNIKDAVLLDVVRRVRLTAADMFGLMHQVPFVSRSVELAGIHADQVAAEYSSGKMSYVEVLESLRNERDTRLATLDNRYNYWVIVARLLSEIGWSTNESGRNPGDELLTRLAQWRSENGG